ncbi:MAG: molybdenum cofactor guanylyltransferase [Candidatus Binatia bacterium]
MREATVIVLAGGASSRMQQPKALLRFGNETLIERVVGALAPVGGATVVVSAAHVPLPPLPPGVGIVEDPVPLLGPAAGILHGLAAAKTDVCFVSSCDQPFPSVPLARALVERIGDAALLIPRWRGHLQPLFAAYRRSLLPAFEAAIASGERRLVTLVEGLGGRELSEKDAARLDPKGLSFFDVDTPERYRQALRLAR